MSSMLSGERRLASASARRGGLTVIGKIAVPKLINLPSQRSENHGLDPSVEIVPKGTLSWGSRSSSSTSNAWGSSTQSPRNDGGNGSPSHLSGRPSSGGSGTRPSTAGSDRAHEPTASAWGPNSRPSSASGSLTSNQTSLRPRSAETRPGSSQLSRFAESLSENPGAWGAAGTAEKLGVTALKNDEFSLTSGDFPTLGSEKDNSGKNTEAQDHGSHGRPGSSSSQTSDNRGAFSSVPVKGKSPESVGNMRAFDDISARNMEHAASGLPEIPQPVSAVPKDSSLIQKIEGLNAKARASDGRHDITFVSSWEGQKNKFHVVNAKANHSANESGTDSVHTERTHASGISNRASHEIGVSAGDKSLESVAVSGTAISRRPTHGMQGRADNRGKGGFNTQEDGWRKKFPVADSPNVVSAARSETNSNLHVHDCHTSVEASEQSGSYPQARDVGESAPPVFDPSDYQAQRPKMKELAKQRAKQRMEEEEERLKKQKAKADAKLEELNRRTLAMEGSTQKPENASYPQARDEGESVPPVFDPSDYQRPKMKEQAICAKQRMEEEEERMKKEKAKAVANLEELNRLITLAVEGSTQMSENAVSIVTVSVGEVVDGISSSCESSLPVNANPVAESSIHQRKKNNRSGKNKHKVAWGAARTAEKLNCSSMDRTEFAEVGGSYDAALVAVIDSKMKELAENLIHAVEGISARVSQMESRTWRLENSLDELKDSVEINYGRSDGKLRELEIILREVQGGIQDLRDKQEIDAKLELLKLQLSRDDQQSKNQNRSVQSNSAQGELSSVPQQSHQPLKVPVAPPQQLPALPTFPHQYTSPISSATAAQLPTQFSQNKIPSIPQADSNPPPLLTLESSRLQYHKPPTQQSQQPSQATHQLPPVAQLSQLPQLHPPPSSVTPYAHRPSSDHPKEIPYMPSQTHPPITHKLSDAADGAPPTQQFLSHPEIRSLKSEDAIDFQLGSLTFQPNISTIRYRICLFIQSY